MSMPARRVALALILVAALAAALLLRPSGRAAGRAETPSRPSDSTPAAAATSFLVGLDARTLLDAQRRRRHVRRWATAGAAAGLQTLYAGEAGRLRRLRGGFARPALMGYRVAKRKPSIATVEIWAVSVASIGRLLPVVGWRTVAVEVRREHGRWKVNAVKDVPGPVLDGRPGEFRRKARAFRTFHVAP